MIPCELNPAATNRPDTSGNWPGGSRVRREALRCREEPGELEHLASSGRAGEPSRAPARSRSQSGPDSARPARDVEPGRLGFPLARTRRRGGRRGSDGRRGSRRGRAGSAATSRRPRHLRLTHTCSAGAAAPTRPPAGELGGPQTGREDGSQRPRRDPSRARHPGTPPPRPHRNPVTRAPSTEPRPARARRGASDRAASPGLTVPSRGNIVAPTTARSPSAASAARLVRGFEHVGPQSRRRGAIETPYRGSSCVPRCGRPTTSPRGESPSRRRCSAARLVQVSVDARHRGRRMVPGPSPPARPRATMSARRAGRSHGRRRGSGPGR